MRKPVKGLFRGKAYNLKEASLALGMSRSALSIIAGYPERWHFLQMLLQEKHMRVISFGEYLCRRGLIRHKKLLGPMLRDLTLNPSKMMGIDTYHRYAMILLCFEEYRKEALSGRRIPDFTDDPEKWI